MPSSQSTIKGKKLRKKSFNCFAAVTGKMCFIFAKNQIPKKIFITAYFIVLLSLSFKRMLGGGRGGGGGGGTIGDLLAWEVLFPFKPGEWGAVAVTGVLVWFSKKKKKVNK